MISVHSYSHVYEWPQNHFIFVNVQVNPNYSSTFVFDNDFPAMLDSSPAPGKYVTSKEILCNMLEVASPWFEW